MAVKSQNKKQDIKLLLMYMDNPEDYLQTTGHLIKPATPKSKVRKALIQKQKNMK